MGAELARVPESFITKSNNFDTGTSKKLLKYVSRGPDIFNELKALRDSENSSVERIDSVKSATSTANPNTI